MNDFRINQIVYWDAGKGWGVIETITSNGLNGEGEKLPDSIGIRCLYGLFVTHPSNLLFASAQEARKHVGNS